MTSLNYFEENQFFIRKLTNLVNLWQRLYEKGKNEYEWIVRMESILGDWICKCESYCKCY